MRKKKLENYSKNWLNMQIDDFFKQKQLPLKAKTLVVATSGGPDSMALLAMLNKIQRQYRFHLIAAHLNHRLRPDSERETEVIEAYCQNTQIEVVNAVWPENLHPQKGIEAAAREFRYAFFQRVMEAKQGDYLLTAHHCDDLLENILLKFIRSGNPSEMNSLQAVSKMHGMTLLRPLLAYEKSFLLTYDKKQNIPFVIDETNNEDDTLRNRVRHQVVPLLKKENPHLDQSALRFNEQINLFTTLIDCQFEQIEQPQRFLGGFYRLKQSSLSHLSKQQQLLYWQHFIWHTWHVRVNESLGKFELIAYQGYFYIGNANVSAPTKPRRVDVGSVFVFGSRRFLISEKVAENARLVGDFQIKKGTKLYFGSLLPGIKLLLKNGQHVKSKKKFAESGIPAILRPFCLTIYADKQVVFVEKTYRFQHASATAQKYYVYALI